MRRWSRRFSLGLAGLAAVLGVAVPAGGQMIGDPEVHRTLDAFHQAASDADFDAYMGLFAEDGVFLGTDATERWSVDEFAEYVAAAFDRGRGWTYRPVARWVSVSGDGSTAWFDERLENDSYGDTRGTGVLVLTADGWKVAQYNLTIPIPNALAREFVARIREGGGE